MKRAVYIATLFSLLIKGAILAQSSELTSTDFSQLESLQAQEARHTLVFLYTDWCRICAAMKKTTLKDAQVVEKLNSDFYFVPFNGEGKEEVVFLGKEFVYKPNGLETGTHELAVQLATIDGKVAYPSVVLLDEQYRIVFQHNAFMDSNQLLAVLNSATKR